MKNIVLTLLLFLCSCIYSMDQEPFVSSSSSPSTNSADQEALTFEQRQKNEEESKGVQDESSGVTSMQEIDHEQEWYCQVRFPKTNNELGWLNTAKSLVGAKQTNYDNIQVCELDNKKLGVLYTVKDKFYTIRILDINSDRCLHNINPLDDEKSSKLLPTQLCRLPENRVACILNSFWGENKKIKIYDINSGKLLKDILIEGEYAENKLDRIQGVYLSENRMALLNQDFERACRFILILDLNSEKIVKKIDLVKKRDGDSLKEKSSSLKYTNVLGIDSAMDKGISVRQALAFFDGRLLLKFGYEICIICTRTDKVDVIKAATYFSDVFILPNGEWLGLDHQNVFKIWNNEKFKFKKIQEILSEDKLVIPDLQNIVLDYLSNDWNSVTIVDRNEHNTLFRVGATYILGETFTVLCKIRDSIGNSDFSVLNVKTGKLKNIILKKELLLKMYKRNSVVVLDHGKRIAFYAEDGSIEIWTNQPKKEVQEGCIIC